MSHPSRRRWLKRSGPTLEQQLAVMVGIEARVDSKATDLLSLEARLERAPHPKIGKGWQPRAEPMVERRDLVASRLFLLREVLTVVLLPDERLDLAPDLYRVERYNLRLVPLIQGHGNLDLARLWASWS